MEPIFAAAPDDELEAPGLEDEGGVRQIETWADGCVLEIEWASHRLCEHNSHNVAQVT